MSEDAKTHLFSTKLSKSASPGFTRYDWAAAIRNIWDKDAAFQTDIVRHTLQDVRSVNDPRMLDIEVASARKDGLFFVPDDEYLLEWFGDMAQNRFAGLYTQSGLCRYAHRLAIPMRDFSGAVPGLIGYSNARVYEQENEAFAKYAYPPSDTLPKGRFMYITAEEYKKAVEEGYVCIIDGIFDKRRLTDYGFNAVSLMGSSITKWHRMYLSRIRNLVVLRDSDQAGCSLLRQCKYLFPRVIEIVQHDAWDIDDYLKTPAHLEAFTKVFRQVQRGGFNYSAEMPRVYNSLEENLRIARERREQQALKSEPPTETLPEKEN